MRLSLDTLGVIAIGIFSGPKLRPREARNRVAPVHHTALQFIQRLKFYSRCVVLYRTKARFSRDSGHEIPRGRPSQDPSRRFCTMFFRFVSCSANAGVSQVPVFGLKNSLNVASAGTVVLYEVLRQWSAAGRLAGSGD